ncbi:pyridoxal phosphate-dependent aminotransferase [Anaeromicrobium sediminis]|uniref:Aminotransferase n=1 Tax=Anaeromicrobium sediminis TaxID=1478221 RepID=A0A267M795_9FIRM|nr:pyridoxal phosphate-dependent aminotransferase [Anaeromicrobium sediminis]PAB55347.1 aspartate aminotransferase [Anaeromicrobium sediminis]
MLSKKAQNITPSLTLGISTKVRELVKEGLDIINFSIGEPDFHTPTKAKEAGIKSIEENHTRYGPASGLVELRQAICNKLQKENHISYNVDEIVVSSGAKHAITNTLMALIDPGDEVIIPKPYWVSYPEMVKLTGGTPIFPTTKKENEFKLTVEDLEKYVTSKTKLLFITNPSNPSGAVYTKEELESIVNYCIEKNIFILADEIYERICYVDNFTSIASLSEKAKEITITINGLSKSVGMTGWRLGYTACNKTLAKAIGALQGHLVSHPSAVSQHAGISALTQCDEDIKLMVDTYKKRRDVAIELIDSIDGLSYVNPEGAFYIFINMSSLKDKISYGDHFSIALADRLLDEGKVAVVPGAAFGMDDYIRISYACSTEVLLEGLERIKNFIEEL